MWEIEESARKVVDAMRNAHKDDVSKQEFTALVFAEGLKIGAKMSSDPHLFGTVETPKNGAATL